MENLKSIKRLEKFHNGGLIADTFTLLSILLIKDLRSKLILVAFFITFTAFLFITKSEIKSMREERVRRRNNFNKITQAYNECMSMLYYIEQLYISNGYSVEKIPSLNKLHKELSNCHFPEDFISLQEKLNIEFEDALNFIYSKKRKSKEDTVSDSEKESSVVKYLRILGLNEDTSNSSDIKKAYIKMIKKYHPDFNGNSIEATEKSKEINDAYDNLQNYFYA
ncbi:MAG: DnaJ domain [Clostridiaceae bacterium]|jgi:hypothetical protein|nr:DnaJ domain [Clostridiaceae bacterium]